MFFDSPEGWKPEISQDLDEVRERVNKEIGHLTWKRRNPEDVEKGWHKLSTQYDEVAGLIKEFAVNCSEAKVGAEVKRQLQAEARPTTEIIGP
jgi:hypothetical protein